MQTRVEKHYFERTDFGSWGWIAKVPESILEVYELYPAWYSQTLSFRSTGPAKLSLHQHLTQPVFSWLHDPLNLTDTAPHVRPASSGSIASLGFGKIARTGPEKFLEFKKPYLCPMEQLMNAQYQGQDATGATIDIWKPYLPECESNIMIKYLGSKSPAQTAGAAKVTGETVLTIDDVREYCYTGSGSASLQWSVPGGAIVRQAENCITVSWPVSGDYVVSVTDMDGRTPSLAVNVASGELWFDDQFDDLITYDWTVDEPAGTSVSIVSGSVKFAVTGSEAQCYILFVNPGPVPTNYTLTMRLKVVNSSGGFSWISFRNDATRLYIDFKPPTTLRVYTTGGGTDYSVANFVNTFIVWKAVVVGNKLNLYRDDVIEVSNHLIGADSGNAGRITYEVFDIGETHLDYLTIEDNG